jgi:transposase
VGQAALAPDKKSARRRRALIAFPDESGFSLLPSVRATWAPRGPTLVLRHRFSWKRLSMAGALVYEPDGSDAHLVFQMRPGAYNDESLIEFLNQFYELEQRHIVLIWDGLPSHRSRRMTDWIVSQRPWLRVERLPGYAHDLNPVEQVWGSLKSRELANLCPDTIDEAAQVADEGLNRIGSETALCLAFLHHCGLRL